MSNNVATEQVDKILNSILSLKDLDIDYSDEHQEHKSDSMPKAKAVILGENDIIVSKDYFDLANSIKKLLAQTDIQLDEKPKKVSRKQKKELEIQLKLQQAHKKALERK